ncbi:2-amino-4-hydroxy-6-hydroxymethyldihydropteridine diphosphokinase [Thiocystis violascens]|uniref:2-amino-4-hydroxy-6-hydroxymethyldihydropteridine diphosphokinase n=1 Tax=Thiocystis violascens (strain ATCC 17096 / DSM 198 / 6111) TaxID=765911 RepID=I3Y9J3_THIV6|nr:2-amino-4-hydroxy-6-hydroxymethyldihydropteridine diphosphokinase [Thiocystis violascens]AFL73661.1 7,8-dihydro-6-hydroxymethylpterin-pyrophosphokinase [Thiocystis violascens DSM 198]
MKDYYIGLGCNLNPARGTRAMLEALLDLAPEIGISRIVATAPVGVVTDALYYNAVVRLRSPEEPATLKTRLIAIETRLGRNRDRCGRACPELPADLDILCCLTPGAHPVLADLPPEPFFQPLILELWAALGLRLPCSPLPVATGIPLLVHGQCCGLQTVFAFHVPACRAVGAARWLSG